MTLRRPAHAARAARALLPLVLSAAAVGACSAKLDPSLSGQPSLSTARVALAGGSSEIAYNICSALLKDRPKDGDLLVCRADALAQMGRPAEAASGYAAALAVAPDQAGARLGLGRLRLATDPAAAEALFLAALARNPRDAATLNNLGIARDLQGHHADAQTAYGEAIGAAPDMRAAQVNLALSLAMSGRSGEAVRIIRPIGERAGASARERQDLAAVLAMDGQPDEAARLLRADLPGAQADSAVEGFRALPRPRNP